MSEIKINKKKDLEKRLLNPRLSSTEILSRTEIFTPIQLEMRKKTRNPQLTVLKLILNFENQKLELITEINKLKEICLHFSNLLKNMVKVDSKNSSENSQHLSNINKTYNHKIQYLQKINEEMKTEMNSYINIIHNIQNCYGNDKRHTDIIKTGIFLDKSKKNFNDELLGLKYLNKRMNKHFVDHMDFFDYWNK
jgi:predicted transcriptional regulator